MPLRHSQRYYVGQIERDGFAIENVIQESTG
jgi:hypothetical protein